MLAYNEYLSLLIIGRRGCGLDSSYATGLRGEMFVVGSCRDSRTEK